MSLTKTYKLLIETNAIVFIELFNILIISYFHIYLMHLHNIN